MSEKAPLTKDQQDEHVHVYIPRSPKNDGCLVCGEPRPVDDLKAHSSKDELVAWLIECANSAGVTYYCGDSGWCSNPNHALKFPTRKAAELRSIGFRAPADPLTRIYVAEHSWA